MRGFILDNLLTLIKGDDGKLRNKYIDNLPNVKNFKVIIQGESIPLAKIGVKKSVKSHLEIETYENKRINRYFEHQIIRLKNLTSEPEKFWKLAALMLKSKVFILVHLNRVSPKWYRDIPLWKLWKDIKEVRRVTLDFRGDIDLKRCYIPKITGSLLDWAMDPNKKWRPLGVPTHPWRIYLSMLNTILVIWLEPHWFKEQHGYFPRKGTLTVWRSILKRVHKPNIYEFDLEQFFPRVEISYVSHLLRQYRTPKWIVEYIENLNKTRPKLCTKDEVDESKIRELQELERGEINRNQSWYKPVEEFIKANGKELWHTLVKEDTGGTTVYHEYEFIQLQHALLSSFKPDQPFSGLLTNLPQGGGISPTLTVQVLKPLFENEEDVVMYADDGIVFGRPKFNCPAYESAGIKLNEKKSGWVKKDNVWLKPLKFCGLIYDGWNDRLYSETSKGKTLEIPKNKVNTMVRSWELWSSEGVPRRNNTWYELMISRISGFIQACLYNGTINLSDYWDRWEISSRRGSWQKSRPAERIFKKKRIKPNLYNSSSVACKWFMNKKLPQYTNAKKVIYL